MMLIKRNNARIRAGRIGRGMEAAISSSPAGCADYGDMHD